MDAPQLFIAIGVLLLVIFYFSKFDLEVEEEEE